MKRLNYSLSALTAFFLTIGLINLNAQDITHPSSGSSNFNVTQGTSVLYFDDGGEGCDDGTPDGSYSNDVISTAIICPDVAGSTITIEFLEVDIETRSSTAPCWDYLRIYDGNSTGADLLFEGCGEDGFQDCSSGGGFDGDGSDGFDIEGGSNDINGTNTGSPANNLFTSTAANGCLTVEFESDGSVDQGGWVATVSASPSTAVPTCDDGIQNGDEEGVDCGGSCPDVCPTCDDGIQNGDETGVDCGGSCGLCPTDVVACGTPLNETFCYGDDNEEVFVYASDNGQPLTITFNAGGIESCCDDVVIYDGNSPAGVELYADNNGGDMTGITVTANSGVMYVTVDSDVSVSCASGSGCCQDPLDWTVACEGAGGPTCDDGIQNGDETGVDCGGSCAPCEVCDFELTINFDNFASETSWEMTTLGGTVVASGDYSGSQSGTTRIEDICVDPGCYDFTIFDSIGDGICCGFGQGSYTLRDSEGNILAEGGDFGDSETTTVCTGGSGSVCEGGVAPTATATVMPFCNNGRFAVMVDLGSIGSANFVTIANTGNDFEYSFVRFPRRYFVGPFQIGEEVDILIYDQNNPDCFTVIGGLTADCNVSLMANPQDNLNSETTRNEISVFPNPTAGEVNVNMVSVMGQEAHIRIMNAVGQLIEERQIDAVESVTERFDLSNQQAGMYFIHVDVAGGESHVERVILGTARP